MNTALGLIIDAAYQGITVPNMSLSHLASLSSTQPHCIHMRLTAPMSRYMSNLLKSQEADPGLQGLTLSARCRQEASTLT